MLPRGPGQAKEDSRSSASGRRTVSLPLATQERKGSQPIQLLAERTVVSWP